MMRQPFGQPYLIVPGEVFLRVMRELNVIGRIRVDEVSRLDREFFKIRAHELPLRECRHVFAEIRFVGYLFVAAERDVEFSLAIESAQTVVTGSIQVLDEAGCFFAVTVIFANDLIEPRSALVKAGFLVLHPEGDT
jgi:hypothetical protein